MSINLWNGKTANQEEKQIIMPLISVKTVNHFLSQPGGETPHWHAPLCYSTVQDDGISFEQEREKWAEVQPILPVSPFPVQRLFRDPVATVYSDTFFGPKRNRVEKSDTPIKVTFFPFLKVCNSKRGGL